MRANAVSRRRLLAAAAWGAGGVGAAGLTGCGAASRSAPAIRADDLDLARRTAAEAGALAAGLVATARRHRDLAAFLRRLTARHQEHVRAFTPDGERLDPRGRRARVSRSAGAALRALVAAQRRAATSTRRAALAADSGDLARALASTAACLAQHAQLLADAADAADGRRGRR